MASADDVVWRVAERMWEEPLATRIRDRRQLDDRVVVALTAEALRTEIEMGGLLAFLENAPLGFTLTDAIRACDVIGAHDSRDRLREVERLMTKHGVTEEQLQADLASSEEQLHAISTFAEVHPGDEVNALVDDLQGVDEILTDDFFVSHAAYWAEHEVLLRALF